MKKLMKTLLLIGIVCFASQSIPVLAETKDAGSTGKHIIYDGKTSEKTAGTHTTLTGNEPDDMSEPAHISLMGKEQADQQRQADFEQRVKEGKYNDLPDLPGIGGTNGDIPEIPSGMV